jgi:hypothetical protein
MKPNSLALIFFIGLITLAGQACRKPAGEGGTSTIRGKVYAFNLRNGVKADSGYVGDIRVFLHFDDHPWADEETRTSYSGDYQFKWLTKGKYKVSIISECDTCPMEQTGVFENVEIKKKNETVTAPDLIGYY